MLASHMCAYRAYATPKRDGWGLLPREAQDAGREDVLVHLGRAARDGEGAHVDAVSSPRARVGIGPEHVAGDLAEVLLGFAPDELRDAALRPDVAAVQRTGDRAVAHELQQLAF